MKCCPLNFSMNSAAFLSFSQMKHHWTLNVCCLLSPVTAWAARTSLRRLLFTGCLSKLTPSFLFRCLFLVSLFSFYHFSFLPLCLCFFWLLWCYLSNYNSVWNSVFEEISDYTQEFICFIDRKLKRSINSWFWHLIIFAIPAFTKKKNRKSTVNTTKSWMCWCVVCFTSGIWSGSFQKHTGTNNSSNQNVHPQLGNSVPVLHLCCIKTETNRDPDFFCMKKTEKYTEDFETVICTDVQQNKFCIKVHNWIRFAQ